MGSNRRSHCYTYWINFSYFHCYQPPATFSQQTMVLSWSTNPSLWKFKCTPGNVLENRCITAWFNVPSTPTIPSFSFVVDIDSYCVTSYHLISLATLPLTRHIHSSSNHGCSSYHTCSSIHTCSSYHACNSIHTYDNKHPYEYTTIIAASTYQCWAT